MSHHPKNFDARSLPGMTMGARKRAARRWVAGGPGPYRTPDYRRRLARGIGNLLAAQAGRIVIDYLIALLRYRIGERLRPCHCDACTSTCYGCEGERFEGDACERCGRVHQARRICDGSGVLPARQRP